MIVDDLDQQMHNRSQSPHVVTPRQQKTSSTKPNAGKVKKRLDYDGNNPKQTNTTELFERLSQPKARPKKEKPKSSQPTTQTNTNGPPVWK